MKNSVALDILGAPAAFAKLNNATLQERKCKWAQKRKLIAAKKREKLHVCLVHRCQASLCGKTSESRDCLLRHLLRVFPNFDTKTFRMFHILLLL